MIKPVKSLEKIVEGLRTSNKSSIQPILEKMERHDRIIEANLGPWNKDVKEFLNSLTPEQLSNYNAQVRAYFNF